MRVEKKKLYDKKMEKSGNLALFSETWIVEIPVTKATTNSWVCGILRDTIVLIYVSYLPWLYEIWLELNSVHLHKRILVHFLFYDRIINLFLPGREEQRNNSWILELQTFRVLIM